MTLFRAVFARRNPDALSITINNFVLIRANNHESLLTAVEGVLIKSKTHIHLTHPCLSASPIDSPTDDLSLTVARLEDRCEALEISVRAKSDAADAEAGRAKAAEARFARLLVWAREEEDRRLQTEEKLRRACEVVQLLEARGKALKEEVS